MISTTKQNIPLNLQKLYQNLPSSSKALVKTLEYNNHQYLEDNFRYKMIPILSKLYPEDREIQSMYRYSSDDDVFCDIFSRISELTYIDWLKVVELKKQEKYKFEFFFIPLFPLILLILIVVLLIGKKKLFNIFYLLHGLPIINDASDEAIEDYEFLIDLATLKHIQVIQDI
ncbi:hypothetical protein [Crocosphaera chwakensis]|uniref:Uncharacterized protein n=1 Tax=Crocosphaera chwakensis CCY0110 TaxID=391612 RepID=A3IZ43_9CHRO|nr:hypothetical protein [Crocosphaera chwakensis]EAZ88247.1 hypothetical protein CY0110_14460 [Crocosphaera chwakensis CCY0110]